MKLEPTETTFVNRDLQARQFAHSHRRRKIRVDERYLAEELGLETPDFTPENIEYVYNELLIRQQLPSDAFLNAVRRDFATDSWDLYVLSNTFDILPANTEAPVTILM